MIYRVRKQLVEGFEAVLSRKRRLTPPVAAIFGGEKEAKLIALACSGAAEGACQCRFKFPQMCRSKIPQLAGFGDQPAGW